MGRTFFYRTAALVLVLTLLAGCLTGCGKKMVENVPGQTSKPGSGYTPPVNEEGYLVVTMPQTLLGGKTAEELEQEDKADRAAASAEDLKTALWSELRANEDGSFSYYMTQEQYEKLRAFYYWAGCLRDPFTVEIAEDYIAGADYSDFDENGIPWGLVVSVDGETYYSLEIWYSAMVSAAPAVWLGRYQVLCGVPGEEWAVHVTVKNAENGEVIFENDFPTRE